MKVQSISLPNLVKKSLLSENMDHNWEDMAVQVINLCGTTFSKSQIIKDLKFTKSAESTVNRIFDGLV